MLKLNKQAAEEVVKMLRSEKETNARLRKEITRAYSIIKELLVDLEEDINERETDTRDED
jgi:hypothetical protein